MKEPSKLAQRLYEIGFISTIKVKRVITSDYNVKSIVTLEGSNGSLDSDWDQLCKYFEPNIWNGFAGRMKYEEANKVKEWKDFQNKNKKEYNEYVRLKRKFES